MTQSIKVKVQGTGRALTNLEVELKNKVENAVQEYKEKNVEAHRKLPCVLFIPEKYEKVMEDLKKLGFYCNYVTQYTFLKEVHCDA